MQIPVLKRGAKLWQRGNVRAIAVALLAAAAIGGCGLSMTSPTRAAATAPLEAADWKTSLVGSYDVSGTDSDGRGYAGSHIVDVSLAPSGALEFAWDNGKYVGVGQMIGNVLAVASLNNNRTMILTMTPSSDGSLSGKWSRRTDRGTQGTETWVRR